MKRLVLETEHETFRDSVRDFIERELEPHARLLKLNSDVEPAVASRLGIQSIPTMLVFKNGRLVDRIVGAQPKPAIAARLLAHVS